MDKSILTQLIKENLSSHQIAKKLNTSQTNVRYWLKKHELKTQHKKFQKKDWGDITHRRCSKCREEKTIDCFYGKKDNKKDKIRFHNYCKSCMEKITVERQQKLKQQCVDYKGGKCVRCGYNEYVGALDFHHIDPSQKEYTIASKKNCSFEYLKPELDKCVLLCRNCHAITHWLEKNGTP